MLKYKIVFNIVCLFMGILVNAQVIDNTASFKNNNSDKYFRLHYDNDYFTATDEYYTQGISFEWVHPALKKNPINNFLIQPRNSDMKYGLRLDHFGYTPTSISSDFIRYGDRPFCGNLSFSTFLIAIDTVKQSRLSSSLTLGVIGSKAGGKEMQVTIHRWLKNIIPVGWEYQIANDVVVNYQIQYEKALWQYRDVFLVNSYSELRVGTHTDKIKTGINFMLGSLNNPYASYVEAQSSKKTWRYYLYGQVQPGFTIYDATLQGGLFNKKSPYTIAAKDLTRLTCQADFGLVVNVGKLTLEYTQSLITKEFKTGHLHRWGGVRIGAIF